MSTLSNLAESLVGSEIVKLGNEINRRIREGEHIYNYTIGDFNSAIFPVPDLLENLIIESYRQKHTGYPTADGIPELRQAVSVFVEHYEGVHYEPDEIQIASGGRPLIYTLFKTLVDQGDKVIYGVPSWNNNHYTSMNLGQHCLVETFPENNFMPTAADLAGHMEGAVLLCLCTPQNPTGTTMDRQALEDICDLVIAENKRRAPGAKKLYLMYDQMYSLLTYGDIKHYNPVQLRPEMKSWTVFVDGISKTFAATGVRVGWALGPSRIMSKMKALLSHMGAWAPMAEQKAVARFLVQTDQIDRFLKEFKEGLWVRLTALYEGFTRLKALGYPVECIAPQAAIYLTVRIDLAGRTAGGQLLEDQAAVTNYLLEKARLAIVPFSCFGAPANSPWYRISVGTSKIEDVQVVMGLLEQALAEVGPAVPAATQP